MTTVHRAIPSDIESLKLLCAAYHSHEGLALTDAEREPALLPLLRDDSFGGILVSRQNHAITGYIAICFGYSIELKGKEAFIDELFVAPEWRRKGTGAALLEAAIAFVSDLGVVALHMEVSHGNLAAKEFYSKHEFEARDQYFLMTRALSS